MVPLPGFWVDWFTNSSKNFQAGQVEALHLLHTKLHQGPDGGGRRVELGHPVLSNDLPAPLVIWVERGALKKYTGGCVEQWTIGDIAMACDPANVCCAPVDVIQLRIEAVLERGGRVEHVARSGM